MTYSNCGKRMSSRRENVPYDVREGCSEGEEAILHKVEEGHDLAPGFSHGNGDRETVSLSAV
jgi:hypothetical protein